MEEKKSRAEVLKETVVKELRKGRGIKEILEELEKKIDRPIKEMEEELEKKIEGQLIPSDLTAFRREMFYNAVETEFKKKVMAERGREETKTWTMTGMLHLISEVMGELEPRHKETLAQQGGKLFLAGNPDPEGFGEADILDRMFFFKDKKYPIPFPLTPLTRKTLKQLQKDPGGIWKRLQKRPGGLTIKGEPELHKTFECVIVGDRGLSEKDRRGTVEIEGKQYDTFEKDIGGNIVTYKSPAERMLPGIVIPAVGQGQIRNILTLKLITYINNLERKEQGLPPEATAEFTFKQYAHKRGKTEAEIQAGGSPLQQFIREIRTGAETIYTVKSPNTKSTFYGTFYTLEIPDSKKEKWRIYWNPPYNKPEPEKLRTYMPILKQAIQDEKANLLFLWEVFYHRSLKGKAGKGRFIRVDNFLLKTKAQKGIRNRDPEAFKYIKENLTYIYRVFRSIDQVTFNKGDKTITLDLEKLENVTYDQFKRDVLQPLGETYFRHILIAFSSDYKPELTEAKAEEKIKDMLPPERPQKAQQPETEREEQLPQEVTEKKKPIFIKGKKWGSGNTFLELFKKEYKVIRKVNYSPQKSDKDKCKNLEETYILKELKRGVKKFFDTLQSGNTKDSYFKDRWNIWAFTKRVNDLTVKDKYGSYMAHQQEMEDKEDELEEAAEIIKPPDTGPEQEKSQEAEPGEVKEATPQHPPETPGQIAEREVREKEAQEQKEAETKQKAEEQKQREQEQQRRKKEEEQKRGFLESFVLLRDIIRIPEEEIPDNPQDLIKMVEGQWRNKINPSYRKAIKRKLKI